MSGLDPSRPDDRDPDAPPPITPETVRALRSSFVGMALMTAVGFVILASLTFLPWWAVLPMFVLWLVLFRAGGVWFTDHPRRVLVLPAWTLLGWLAVALSLALLTDVVRDEPTVDPFPDPPASPSAPASPDGSPDGDATDAPTPGSTTAPADG